MARSTAKPLAMPPRSMRVPGARKRMRRPASISTASPATAASPAGSAAVAGSRPASCRSGATVMSYAPCERRLRSIAAAITSQVHASTRTGRVAAARLSRLTSLAGSWKLISRWTAAIAGKAASAAAWSRERSGPIAAISTKVPSRGRARRISADAMTEKPEDLLHAFGDVMAGERRARDIADVVADREGARAGLADELREPARPAHLAAVGFAILQDVDAMDAAARVERHGIIDVEMLADHAVEHEQPDHLAAGLRLPHAPGLRLDELRRRRKRELLRLRNRQVLHRMSGR